MNPNQSAFKKKAACNLGLKDLRTSFMIIYVHIDCAGWLAFPLPYRGEHVYTYVKGHTYV